MNKIIDGWDGTPPELESYQFFSPIYDIDFTVSPMGYKWDLRETVGDGHGLRVV